MSVYNRLGLTEAQKSCVEKVHDLALEHYTRRAKSRKEPIPDEATANEIAQKLVIITLSVAKTVGYDVKHSDIAKLVYSQVDDTFGYAEDIEVGIVK
ncbi:MAG: hypothetical protein EBQ80_04975 [Proteobacteria bacterium]|nr:hypothetical protein [Pseudomonadota bacterium]